MYFGITDSIINVAGVCAIHACRLQCREREHERDIYQGGRGELREGGREGWSVQEGAFMCICDPPPLAICVEQKYMEALRSLFTLEIC